MPTLAHKLANLVTAIRNCEKSRNREWEDRHREALEKLSEQLPSGGGFDNGTKLDLIKSDANKLVFNTAYHHMDDYGGYDGWTNHRVVVTGHLLFGLDIKISGRDRRGIKDYVHETFDILLKQET